jgi:hypothetical protein
MSDLTNPPVAAQCGLDEDDRRASRGRWSALVYWLKKSRDAWKAKYVKLKAEVHRMKVRVADVLNSRQRWRERAEVSEAKVAEMEAELKRLQAYISEPPNDQIKTQPRSRRPPAPKRLRCG